MKRILIILLLIITFSWLSMSEITLAEGIGDNFSGGSDSSGNPNRQGAGGDRGICPSNSNSDNTPDSLRLTPLIPIPEKLMPKIKANSTWIESPRTLTTRKDPTFWFYISKPAKRLKKAEFMLLDKNYNYAIDKPILIDISPADFSEKIKPFSFTVKDKALNDGVYHWFFSIVCDFEQPSRNQNFEGWIEKVSVSKELKVQLAEASETQRIEIYFQKKIWHEFVDLIARKQQDIPNEKITLNQKSYTIGEVWNQILTEVGL
jgi:hypothetical protein